MIGRIQNFRITRKVAKYGNKKPRRAIIYMLCGTVIVENKQGKRLGVNNYQGRVFDLIWRLIKLNVEGYNSGIEFRFEKYV